MKDWTQTLAVGIGLAGLIITLHLQTQSGIADMEARIGARLDQIDSRIETIDARVYELNERVTRVEEQNVRIEDRLSRVETLILDSFE